MKKRALLLVMLMLICVSFVSVNNADAKTYKFKKNEINSHIRLSEFSELYVNEKGRIQYIDYTTHKKNTLDDCWYTKMNCYMLNGKSEKRINSFKVPMNSATEIYNCVRIVDEKVITLMEKDGTIYVDEYDDKGKKVFSFKTKEFTKKNYSYELKNIIWDDGNNIYYIYEYEVNNDYKYKLCKVNKKTKKVERRNLNANSYDIRFENGYIYELCEKEINIFSLKGKKLSTIMLPEGETYYEINVGTDDYVKLSVHEIGVYGDYLFYCNKNGVYRCNINNLKKNSKFKLYYDAKGDEYFEQDYEIDELCIKDKDTFCIKVAHSSDFEPCADQDGVKLVKYSRKK